MKMTADQRRKLRDYISAIGVGELPELLEILTEVEDDSELIEMAIIASVFDGTPVNIADYLAVNGVCTEDVAAAFASIITRLRRAPHGWN